MAKYALVIGAWGPCRGRWGLPQREFTHKPLEINTTKIDPKFTGIDDFWNICRTAHMGCQCEGIMKCRFLGLEITPTTQRLAVLWQTPLKILHHRIPPNREVQVPCYKFKLNQNFSLDLLEPPWVPIAVFLRAPSDRESQHLRTVRSLW